MASVPSPKESAEELLKIFVHNFNCRPGYVLRINSFTSAMDKRGMHRDDFIPGMEYAIEQKWVEVAGESHSFRLTEAGFSACPEEHPNYGAIMPATVNHNSINIQTAVNSPIAQAVGSTQTQNVQYQAPTMDQLETLVRIFRNNVDDLGLSDQEKKKVLAQVATIEAQMLDEPNQNIVKEAGRTIKNITEGAIGSLLATAAQPGIWLAAQTILAMFL